MQDPHVDISLWYMLLEGVTFVKELLDAYPLRLFMCMECLSCLYGEVYPDP